MLSKNSVIFLRFSAKTFSHDVFRPHPATLNIQKCEDIYTCAAAYFANEDDWAGVTTSPLPSWWL